MNKEQVKELAEINATYIFDRATKQYGEFTDEYVRLFYNKFAELRSEIANNHTCRCDSRKTNADRIRNMSDEELADTLFDSCLEVMHIDECPYADNVGMCKKCISEWLQSEAE